MGAQDLHRGGRPGVRAAVFVCTAAVTLAVDQLTKLWALAALGDGRTIPVLPPLLSLTLVRNPGASLGFGSGATWAISLLAVAACIVLPLLAWRTSSTAWTAALALGFAGAGGNLIDRIVYARGFLDGEVVDFLDYGWSVGNVADVALLAAGVAVVVLILVDVPFRGGRRGTETQGRSES